MARKRRRGNGQTEATTEDGRTLNVEVNQPGGSNLDIEDAVKFIHAANVAQLHGLHAVLDKRLREFPEQSSGKALVETPRDRTGSFSNLVRYVQTAIEEDFDTIRALDDAVCERLTKSGM